MSAVICTTSRMRSIIWSSSMPVIVSGRKPDQWSVSAVVDR